MKKETGRAVEAERLLEQGEKAFKVHEQMLRLVNKDMAKKIEELEKEKSHLADENLSLKTEKIESSKQHSAELDEDPSTWDVTGWKDAFKRLMGSEGEASVDEKVPEEISGSKSIVATS